MIASTTRWNVDNAVEEIGNALYPEDSNVRIEIDSLYPLIYVFSGKLDPWTAFKIIVREPPAYVERLVPVEAIVSERVDCRSPHNVCCTDTIRAIGLLAAAKGVGDDVNVEVKPRRYFVGCDDRTAVRLFSRALEEVLKLRIRRKAKYTVKVEDTLHGIVVALLRSGWDRLRFWRERRLLSK